MMDWEREDLVNNLGDLLSQCERDVQERMLWHLFMVHDDYGTRVGQKIGLSANDVAKLQPLATQVLTEDEKKRVQNLGKNGDKIDPTVWGTWTSSVHNHQAKAGDVLNGMKGVKIEPEPKPQPV